MIGAVVKVEAFPSKWNGDLDICHEVKRLYTIVVCDGALNSLAASSQAIDLTSHQYQPKKTSEPHKHWE